jgi:hypothetical protein
MKSIGRRSLFRNFVTGGALAGVAAAQNTQPASQNAGNSTSSRRMVTGEVRPGCAPEEDTKCI